MTLLRFKTATLLLWMALFAASWALTLALENGKRYSALHSGFLDMNGSLIIV